MIQEYKSSVERLAKLFKQSRERWKQRALELQKKLRAKEVRIRDLEKSRELWKRRAKTAEQIVREYRTTEKRQAMQPDDDLDAGPLEALEATPDPETQNNGHCQWSKVRGHHYGVKIIHLAVAFVIQSLNSFRGAAQNFALLGQYFGQARPSYSSIRQWVLRVGLYELQRPRENRSDWLFVVDMTLELGARKCLVVLGISQCRWQHLVKEASGKLSYQEMEVLGLEVMSQSKGEAKYRRP